LPVKEYEAILADTAQAHCSVDSLLLSLPLDDGDEDIQDADALPLVQLPVSRLVLSKRPLRSSQPAMVSRKGSSSGSSSSSSDSNNGIDKVSVHNGPNLEASSSAFAAIPGSVGEVDVLPLVPRGISTRERLAPDLTMEDYTRADGTRYRRLFIQCPFQHSEHWSVGGQICCKQRSIGPRTTADLGDREPEAFLRAWCAAASRFRNCATHKKFNPSKTDVLSQLQSLPGH
jgi:hypothetical protein